VKEEVADINKTACNCGSAPDADIRKCVEEVVAITGGSRESLIRILQDVQLKLNYLPSEH
jgi:hypothetical protein